MTNYPYRYINLEGLTKRQREVVNTLLKGNTYQGVADKLGVSIGTVYQQLKRVRDKHPSVYRAIMILRKEQLAQRHEEALERAEEHSRRYFRRRSNRQYKEKYGYYPWERWLYKR